MNECLKYQKPNEKCMEYAIITHNIDFVTFLMYEYNIKIDLNYCQYNVEVLISHGANVNEKDNNGMTLLHYAAENNSKETAELLISHGAKTITFKDIMLLLLLILFIMKFLHIM
ncbi:hypothetical protein TVAG_282160 [Trichomonas vaginalis G3]|uniref:DUF3447 domain-containing protein n=1 Tax=Trichomonas vaginalis (strain ATCC PRA-98 / G3) TaxID=412133 RepID=A2E9T1_TRIV3|nr:ankyrin repeat and SOCS box-containing protein 4 family [Trichomonas vaginalis G3]EAY10616.1 hypothetical protein TVAG_282160 [Trichomonas vaginalis G3]KAI5540868.1 ankyrin repeat and SOCS box-containing protein 4 family [Trichomonas vaginalis G3]|eukprot:XP_001322839.1 hypothetical protein [Trichomonas vaginalis G3]